MGVILSNLYYSVDENEYVVDSGDEFIVRIDIPGPEIMTFNVKISSDGYFLIPDAPGLYLRGLKLIDAKKVVNRHLKRFYPNAEIESYLDKK